MAPLLAEERQSPAPKIGPSTSRGALASWLRPVRSGWTPAALVTVAILVALRHFAVPLPTSLAFLAYMVVCITVPGTLIWRACHRDAPRPFAEDVLAGAVVGYAMEILLYLPARAVGAPLLVLLGPLATIGAFLVVPGLRRHWRGSPTAERAPVWWSWTLAGVVVGVLVWSYLIVSQRGLGWPGWALVDLDSPYHLALAGELKHHVPPQVPFLSSDPLLYHWFVYADIAATSWVTGIEPEMLLYRLSMIPLLALLPLLVAVAARRLTGRWWPGLAAVYVSQFAVSPNPYGWRLPAGAFFNGAAIVEDSTLMRQSLWTSPTQTFGAALFVPVVMVLIDLLRGNGRGRRHWALLTVLVLASMGTKATFLPLLFAGLCLVIVVDLVVRRRWNRPALIASGITLASLVFAQLVLFGASSGGLVWSPLTSLSASNVSFMTGLTQAPRSPTWAAVEILALVLTCWACIWFGVVGLAVRRLLLKPEYLLLVGIGLPALGIMLLLDQVGGSQGFFLQSARPYLGLAAAAGLAAAFAGFRPRRGGVAILLGSVLAGAAIVLTVRALGDPTPPSAHRQGGQRALMVALTLPYLQVIGAIALLAAAGLLARRRWPALRGIIVAIVIAAVTGCTLPSVYDQLKGNAVDARARGWQWQRDEVPTAPEGTRRAARWLRDHSDPDDLVATNAHCRPFPDNSLCDNRIFWFAAYAERHFLVESWGYTARSHDESLRQGKFASIVDFWDPSLLAANDFAFTAPSPETIGRLRDGHHVRWLLVDERLEHSPEIGRYATLRYRTGGCAVYELTR